MCCSARSEELRQSQAATLEQAWRYEAKHLGDFKRIYPREGGEKYDKYFKHSSSLFQETAASKAREECARYPQHAFNTLCTVQQKAPSGAWLLSSHKNGGKWVTAVLLETIKICLLLDFKPLNVFVL